jgi:hypothetical protein
MLDTCRTVSLRIDGLLAVESQFLFEESRLRMRHAPSPASGSGVAIPSRTIPLSRKGQPERDSDIVRGELACGLPGSARSLFLDSHPFLAAAEVAIAGIRSATEYPAQAGSAAPPLEVICYLPLSIFWYICKESRDASTALPVAILRTTLSLMPPKSGSRESFISIR